MKNKSLIIFIAALIGLSLPASADKMSRMQSIILQDTQEGIKENCKEDYVECANSISAADRQDLIEELKALDEEEQIALMTSAVKKKKIKAIKVFLAADILPDYNALFLANDKIIDVFKDSIQTIDKCAIVGQAIEAGVYPSILMKSLRILDKDEFIDQCSAAGLADNFQEENAKVLLNFVDGNADSLKAYITLRGKLRKISLLAYCVIGKVQETSAEDEDKVFSFLLRHNADLNQELYPGSGLILQDLLDQYKQVGKPLEFY